MHRHPLPPARVLVLSMLTAALSTRVFLLLFPGAGDGIAGIHVHHLLVGVLLMAAAGIPSLLLNQEESAGIGAVVVFGFGLGLALDEWVLLVLRETSPDLAYQSPASLAGGTVMLALGCLYVVLVQTRSAAGDQTPPSSRGSSR